MGGAAFPAHVKLAPPKGTKIDYLIANGAECEPYLTIDERTMRESAAKVVDGVAIAMHLTGAQNGIVALEDNKADLVPSSRPRSPRSDVTRSGPAPAPYPSPSARRSIPRAARRC
jgi:Na+-translocating ferredoxin:NAD+ oxidoreductase RnfC subunit